MSSPFFGDAQSCNEALSSLSVGEDGLSGGFAGAGGGHCLGDCILRQSAAARARGGQVLLVLRRGRGWIRCCGPAAPARLEVEAAL